MSDFAKKLNQLLAKSEPRETIREHTDNLLKQAELLKNSGYVSSSELYHDLLIACEYHDYGKANKKFQRRIVKRYKFNEKEELPHNVLSVYFIDKEQCNDFTNVGSAVLYHHFHNTSPLTILWSNGDRIIEDLEEIEDFDDIDKVMENVDELTDDIRDLLKKSVSEKISYILLKGFLHKCDYSASAGIECEIKNDFLESIMEQWCEKYTPRKLQEFCLNHRDSDIIATAPTGMGKTEAGLLWCGNHKCFFVLPLKTAINAMYDRIKEMMGEDYKNRVGLLHSDTKMIYMLDNMKKDESIDIPETDFDYINRTKQLSMPITVCTPDQIFDFVLKYPGYEYKLATTSYSKFIVDEIQAYDPELLAAIMYGIKLIKLMGGKIAVLTATLPPFVHEELKKILDTDCPDKDFSSYGITRHYMKVHEKAMSAEDIISVTDHIKSDNVKKFLVVCNAVDTANEIFTQLKEYYENTNVKVNLFHARFTKGDRKVKEELILKSSERTDTEIWVSTSVVEASLDIDFDILFTELSELFSLFQRMGRVNRQGLKPFDKTNCYVYTELQGNAKRYSFYDKEIYSFSKEAVMSVGEGVIDEQKKHDLIEEYLSCEKVYKTEFFKKYQETMEYYDNLKDYLNDKPVDGLRKIFACDVIPIGIYEENKTEIETAKQILLSRNVLTEEQKAGLTPKEIREMTSARKLQAQNSLNRFMVSVSQYRAKKNINATYMDRQLGILVINNCEYDFENGLRFTQDEEDEELQKTWNIW